MEPRTATRTIVQVNLDGCPVGFLFRGKNPDWSHEERCFPGMVAPLNHRGWKPESFFHLIDVAEGKVLEHRMKGEETLVTADQELADYQIEASVRQFVPGAWGNMDDEYCTVARNGLVFRQQDLRRYYQLCLEGLDRVVLVRRCDYQRTVLGERRYPLDPTRYYRLLAQVEGDRIRCWCDGELVADVRDAEYSSGAAGIRVNSICRLRDIRVATWDQGHQANLAHRDARQRDLEEARAAVPQPVLWRSYPVATGGRVHFFRPDEGAAPRLLVVGGEDVARGFAMYDLDGGLLWQAPGHSGGAGTCKFADMDGDGIKEIVSFFDGGMAIHSSVSGERLAWAPMPAPGPFDQNRERPTIHQLYPAALRQAHHCDGVVIFDQCGSAGGWTFWVFDASLQLRFSRTVELPPMGHNINLCDVNGDGREEILAGYHCYDGDGELLWRVEEARYWDIVQGARHPDSVIAAELWPGAMRAAYAGGGEGFVLVDATSGKVLAHRLIGHAQGVTVGKFRKDLPGHQILIGNRHESYGILSFFDGEGQPIGRFQPDYFSQGGAPVNWGGEGAELVLLTSSAQAFGLWDVHGRKVVDLGQLDCFGGLPAAQRCAAVAPPSDITGDPRDELAVQHGDRVFVYTQDRPFQGSRIYAPRRNERIMGPAISLEGWRPWPR